ncbi:MAG: transporter, partial [Proteobacteria bacterium]|nr:transporter [Pseudomonadota bacterium]
MNAAPVTVLVALLGTSAPALATDLEEPAAPPAGAGTSAALRPASDAAWWTGSLLSASAETLAVGHWLVEPYVLDQRIDGSFDAGGRRHDAPSLDRAWSAAYLMYGLADGVSIGAQPRALLDARTAGARLSGPTAGDVTAMLQLRLAPHHPPGAWPAVSLVLGETFPTGRFDRLSGGPDAASGAGVHRTDVSVYAQSLVPAG